MGVEFAKYVAAVVQAAPVFLNRKATTEKTFKVIFQNLKKKTGVVETRAATYFANSTPIQEKIIPYRWFCQFMSAPATKELTYQRLI